jgi:hypothetical protein
MQKIAWRVIGTLIELVAIRSAMVCMGVGNALCSQSPMLEARSSVYVSEKTLEGMLTSYRGQWSKRTQLTIGAQH